MRNRARGFTLLELLVVLALLAITATFAVPNFSAWWQQRQMNLLAEQMHTLLRHARTEAMRLNAPVYVCMAQIKKDNTLDNHCNGKYFGHAFVAWADVNGSQNYDGKDDAGSTNFYTTDFMLRSVLLNEQNRPMKAWVAMQHFGLQGQNSSSGADADVLAFLPDGSVQRWKSAQRRNGVLTQHYPAAAYTKITFSSASDDASERAQQSAAVIVDSTGRSEVCRASSQAKICAFSDPAKAAVAYQGT